MKDDTERKSILHDVASRVVEDYVDLFAEMKQHPSGDAMVYLLVWSLVLGCYT